MGYSSVEPISSIQLGVPALSQPLYLVELAMDHILPEAISYVLQVVNVMEGIEGQIVDANRRLKAQQLGELKLRNSNDEPTENDKLWEQYGMWATTLSDELAAPINPYSGRFRMLGLAGYGAGSSVVQHPAR